MSPSHHPMVIGANSAPTGTPNLGLVRGESALLTFLALLTLLGLHKWNLKCLAISV